MPSTGFNPGRLYDALLELLGLLAGLSIGALALAVSLDVVMRNTGLGNFPWLLDLAEYVIYGSTFLAAPWVLRQGAHVRVDLLAHTLPGPLARRLEMLTDLGGLAISLTLAWYGWQVTAESYALGGLVVKELVVAEWWLLLLIPCSSVLLAIEFVLRIARAPGAR